MFAVQGKAMRNGKALLLGSELNTIMGIKRGVVMDIELTNAVSRSDAMHPVSPSLHGRA